MHLLIVSFGKLKNAGFRQTADHYQKNIRPWAKIEEIELKPIEVPDKGPATRQLIQQKEEQELLERLSKRISTRALIFLLDEGGKTMPTRDWAKLIKDAEESGVSEMVFCIGSSLGFIKTKEGALQARAKMTLSFGPQTLSHELAKIVLLEQLYRSFSVIRGHPYHNEG